jgi:hypothetical protein
LALGWGFTRKKFPEKYPVGLDPQEGFAEENEDRSVEDTVGVEVDVLDVIVLKKPLEEIACRERQPSLCESREHGDLIWVLLHGIRISRSGTPHVDLLLPKKPTVEERQQILGLRFRLLPLLVGIWPRRRYRRLSPAAHLAVSSRDLFFPPAVFKLFDGEGYILQVQQVFTRIRSGATVVAFGGALGSTLSSGVAVRTGRGF